MRLAFRERFLLLKGKACFPIVGERDLSLTSLYEATVTASIM
jgi:hypothetical protein